MSAFHFFFCLNSSYGLATTHLTQRPCYQRGSRCRDPAGNWTTRRPPNHRKEAKLQWCGHVSRSSGLAKTILQSTMKGGKKTKQTVEEVGRQYQGMDRPGVRQVPVGSGEEGKMGKWRELVAKSSVVPQRPSCLRDRWWWWWWWRHYLLLVLKSWHKCSGPGSASHMHPR